MVDPNSCRVDLALTLFHFKPGGSVAVQALYIFGVFLRSAHRIPAKQDPMPLTFLRSRMDFKYFNFVFIRSEFAM